MAIEIQRAVTEEQFLQGADLFREYANFLGVDLEFQGFAKELESIASMYGPPRGALLLAKQKAGYVGVVGLREFKPGIAEMKRLYVRKAVQGQGIGKRLVQAFIEEAARLGYQEVWLDTIPELATALRLYRRFDFAEIEAYRFNPHPQAVFLGRSLSHPLTAIEGS